MMENADRIMAKSSALPEDRRERVLRGAAAGIVALSIGVFVGQIALRGKG